MKTIPATKYWVSEEGLVYNRDLVRIKLREHRTGYLIFSIGKETKFVHKEVAKLYLDNPFNMEDIIHLNGDIKDNRLANLFWCGKQDFDKLKILHLRQSGNSIEHIAQGFGLSKSMVYRIVRNAQNIGQDAEAPKS
jgi:hypothetical protein